MTWEEYYEKIWEWEPSTMVKHMSELSSFGPPEEVMEAIVEISFGDPKGATGMLRKALDAGIKFNGEQLSNISGDCDESEMERALSLSADQFTAQDMEDLYGAYEDVRLIEIALQYNLTIPEELAEENEELLIPNTDTPIGWERFYNNYDNWTKAYAKKRFGALTSYGEEEELTEVICNLFDDDKAGASKYIRKMLDQGIIFSGDNLVEIAYVCDDLTARKAVLAAQYSLDEGLLEELYGVVDDSLIVQVAGKNGLKLPESIREDIDLRKEELSEDYDYVLQCLREAHENLVLAYKLSIADAGSHKRSLSILKHACFIEAEPYIDKARVILDEINPEVQGILRMQSTKLNMGKRGIFHDVYVDGFVTNWMVQRRIKKLIQAVEDAHQEVMRARDRLLD